MKGQRLSGCVVLVVEDEPLVGIDLVDMLGAAGARVLSAKRADEAIAREKQLKRWKRDWKIELIERENLEWRDLSDLLA